MKPALTLAATALIGASALGQSTHSQELAHTQTAFDILVLLPYAQAAPLFGPEGERPWAGKHWNPQFLYPRPAHDQQGAVFTVQHGPVTAVWVNTVFDLEARRFQYVYFIPGIMVTTIDVKFDPADNSTKIHVVYTRTALTSEGNEHVAQFTANDKSAGQDWQQALDDYLARKH